MNLLLEPGFHLTDLDECRQFRVQRREVFRVWCVHCRVPMRRHYSTFSYGLRVQRWLCPRCDASYGLPVQLRSTCNHAQRHPKGKRGVRPLAAAVSPADRRRIERLLAGFCARCGEPAYGFANCESCRADRRSYDSKRKARLGFLVMRPPNRFDRI